MRKHSPKSEGGSSTVCVHDEADLRAGGVPSVVRTWRCLSLQSASSSSTGLPALSTAVNGARTVRACASCGPARASSGPLENMSGVILSADCSVWERGDRKRRGVPEENCSMGTAPVSA
jgi:hypothetical protein